MVSSHFFFATLRTLLLHRQTTVTLQSLSLRARDIMKENPFYNFFRYSFLIAGSGVYDPTEFQASNQTAGTLMENLSNNMPIPS